MTDRIHDDEPDVGEDVVLALLAAECPQWCGRPIEYLKTSGTSNAMWRVHLGGQRDLVVRLPRRPESAAGVEQEVALLRLVERSPIAAIVKTPIVCHVGRPHDVFPHRWSVLEWIDGTDAWACRDDLSARSLGSLASDMGRLVRTLRDVNDLAGLPRRSPGDRGGPLLPLLERLDRWLDDPAWNAHGLVDVAAVRRLAAPAFEVADEPVAHGLVHGDLIPGNLLVDDGRLDAVLDWGGAGWGDTAQDLAPAWAVLTAAERDRFREVVGADGAAWIRGRTFELEHAVGGVLYYVPRKHPLGDVMARTLDRILTET